MRDALPDIVRLKLLVEGLVGDATVAKTTALTVLVSRFAAILGEGTKYDDAFYILIRSINDLSLIVEQQFPDGGGKRTAMNVVEKLKSIISPHLLSQPFESYLSRTATDRVVICSAIGLLEDIQFDTDAFISHSVEIIS